MESESPADAVAKKPDVTHGKVVGAAAMPEKKPGGARRPDIDTLYTINADGSHNKVYTADVKGRFQNRKKILWAIMLGIYVVMPWVKIHGNPAILIDLPNRNFYLFGGTFNAQDFQLAFLYVTGLAFALFVVSAIWGRLWCGYACPQTVFLEGVYRRVERLFEGDAGRRKKLAAMPWNREKVLRRGGKWAAFLILSMVLSHTFLSYFMPVERVFAAITSPPSAHPTAFSFILIFTAIIFFNFTWFREQLCIVICPYGRLQGVLYDADTINVTYDHVRGEPRGHYSRTHKAGDAGTDAEGDAERGDCIDCYRCVSVCPTGIDIRNGTQLECVGCANCIDACDAVMDKLGQPRGLVRYDSLRGIETGQRRFLRPRLALYGVLLAVGVTVFLVAAVGRKSFEAEPERIPGPMFAIDEDAGLIRNSFRLHLFNKRPEPSEFAIEGVDQDGVGFELGALRPQLESLEDRKVAVVVTIDREVFYTGMKAQVRVSVGDEERLIDLVLQGPFRKKR